ncbi:ABC transporter substrate-binding protein [Actinoallomurus iriomotensis]|uniref:ABC transporter substrate-binding protein n=1 Tax=Actinoallomurus iriomotensis TaxID=478107 RepID=A0A9W6VS23_9ACTN|nr:ABC transporter substrate-binding protein [Actinoallomurus iriomotensis]GLY77604.1 ABC transporter substrate-binding protein [Actinoallomurus iriomotensis]
MPGTHDLSRRGLLAAGGAAGLGALLAACGGNGGARATTSGSWSFTDDRGQKATAKSRPKRVVAYVGTAAALHDFGVGDQLVGVFGPTKLKDGRPDPLAGSLDVNKVTIIGNAYGEFNIEKYAALHPDLLVTEMFQPPNLWFVPDDSKNKILPLAPSIGFTDSHVSLPQPIQRHEQLAAALGADLKAAPVTAAKARFDQAVESVRAAAKANPGIKVLAASGSPDLFYVSDPRVYADLSYFQSLGVDMIVPNKVTGGFFENLSWENADKYPADIILLDNRTAALQPKDLTAKPSWSKLPAVKAGQITPWLSEARFSYAGCAPVLEAFAKAVRDAKKVS